jgi:hypothetical protein
MQRRKGFVLLASGAALTLSLVAPTAASAAIAGGPSAVPARAGTVPGGVISNRGHVFQIGPGKIFQVHDSVHGVRRGDRLALESLYRLHQHHPRSPKRWHIIGSWPMHAGQTFFRGLTRGSFAGLYSLRLQFIRHHHLLPHSQSNVFYVRVLHFHQKKLHKPKHHQPVHHPHTVLAAHGLAVPKAPSGVSGWDSVECASIDAGLGGGGVYVTPPIRHLGNGSAVNTVQVSFYSNWNGQAWGPWQTGSTLPQTIQPDGTGGGELVLSGDGSGSSVTPSDELGTVSPLDFFGSAGFHSIGWDLAIENPATGAWGWLSPTILQPEGYQQYDQNGNLEGTSQSCQTFHGIGFGVAGGH